MKVKDREAMLAKVERFNQLHSELAAANDAVREIMAISGNHSEVKELAALRLFPVADPSCHPINVACTGLNTYALRCAILPIVTKARDEIQKAIDDL